LSMATLATLFFVAVVYSLLRHKQSNVSGEAEVALAEPHIDSTMTSRLHEE
jgi:cbb3-type cytochrome oxidase subunit 3